MAEAVLRAGQALCGGRPCADLRTGGEGAPGNAVQLRCHRVLAYSAGGRFHTHVDGRQHPTHQGNVVLVLPGGKYRGGYLQVESRPGVSEVLHREVGDKRKPGNETWCVTALPFVRHSVHPVQCGQRTVVVFQVCAVQERSVVEAAVEGESGAVHSTAPALDELQGMPDAAHADWENVLNGYAESIREFQGDLQEAQDDAQRKYDALQQRRAQVQPAVPVTLETLWEVLGVTNTPDMQHLPPVVKVIVTREEGSPLELWAAQCMRHLGYTWGPPERVQHSLTQLGVHEGGVVSQRRRLLDAMGPSNAFPFEVQSAEDEGEVGNRPFDGHFPTWSLQATAELSEDAVTSASFLRTAWRTVQVSPKEQYQDSWDGDYVTVSLPLWRFTMKYTAR